MNRIGTYRRLLLPMLAAAILIAAAGCRSQKAETPDTHLWETHYAAGEKAYSAGDYPEAERMYCLALKDAEESIPTDHHVAKILNRLAQVYEEQGKLDAAEPLFKRALAIYEKVFGNEHQYVATALNNLGLLYEAQVDGIGSNTSEQPS